MFTGCSMIFHTQEGERYAEQNGEMKPIGLYHEYTRNFVNKTSVNLRCTFRDAPRHCKATLTLEPKDLGIIETEKIEGKRNKHFLKSDERWTKLMLDPEFWKVRERKGGFVGHTCNDPIFTEDQPHDSPGLPPKKRQKRSQKRNHILGALSRELRATANEKTIRTQEFEVKNISKEWELDRAENGEDFLAHVVDLKKEKKAYYYHKNKDQLINRVDDIEPKLSKITLSNGAPFYGATTHQWIHKSSSNNFLAFFIKSELPLLQAEALFCDGTFQLTKNLNYSQTYIISRRFYTRKKVFSYPIFFCFMAKKTKSSYVEVLKFLIKACREAGFKLEPKSLHCDGESAFIKAAKDCFPGASIVLCSVHLIRCVMRKMKEYFGGKFYKDPALKSLFTFIKGLIYLNLTNFQILSKIKNYMYEEICTEKKLKEKIHEFLDCYFVHYYLRPDATFNFCLFNYFSMITTFNDHSTTTNSLECINKKLKAEAGTGFITFNRALKSIRNFKVEYRGEYQTTVVEGNLNNRRLTAVEREDFMRRELSRYNMLPEESQLEQVIELCFKIGSVNEHNVIGQFEKRIAEDIADLDEEDELHLDDELN